MMTPKLTEEEMIACEEVAKDQLEFWSHFPYESHHQILANMVIVAAKRREECEAKDKVIELLRAENDESKAFADFCKEQSDCDERARLEAEEKCEALRAENEKLKAENERLNKTIEARRELLGEDRIADCHLFEARIGDRK